MVDKTGDSTCRAIQNASEGEKNDGKRSPGRQSVTANPAPSKATGQAGEDIAPGDEDQMLAKMARLEDARLNEEAVSMGAK